jgi:hypothetical protein
LKARIIREEKAGGPERLPSGGIVPGDAAVVEVDPPLEGHRFVFVSETVVFGDPETYAFPATADGHVASWLELEISQKGSISWRDLLASAGYEVMS